MEIIQGPGGGIVEDDVAIEIIKKVTNRHDFQIDGKPEIEVEPALLSLFCNELDKRRIEMYYDMISMDLVTEFGDNIIAEFYNSAMEQVSPKAVEILENSLLTGDGFRDNMSLNDALRNGITKDDI